MNIPSCMASLLRFVPADGGNSCTGTRPPDERARDAEEACRARHVRRVRGNRSSGRARSPAAGADPDPRPSRALRAPPPARFPAHLARGRVQRDDPLARDPRHRPLHVPRDRLAVPRDRDALRKDPPRHFVGRSDRRPRRPSRPQAPARGKLRGAHRRRRGPLRPRALRPARPLARRRRCAAERVHLGHGPPGPPDPPRRDRGKPAPRGRHEPRHGDRPRDPGHRPARGRSAAPLARHRRRLCPRRRPSTARAS